MFALFPNFAPQLVPRIFGLFSSWKPGWNFSYEPTAKLVLVTGPACSTALMWRGPNKYDRHDSSAETTSVVWATIAIIEKPALK